MERWGIGIETAKNTICATTQLCVKGAEPTLNRRFKNNDRMLRYPRITSDVFMDTLFASKKSGKSSRGYSCCQIFATPFGNVMGIPIIYKKGHNVTNTMKIYFKEIGVPPDLIADGARDQVQVEALRLANQSGYQIVELDKGTPDTNRAKRYIQMLNNETKLDLVDSDSLMVFWCYCMERRAQIINTTVRENYPFQQETLHSKITGRPCDISDLCRYGWYKWVK